MGKAILVILIIAALFIPVVLLAIFKKVVGKQNFEEREKKMDSYKRAKINTSVNASTFAQLWSPDNAFGHGGGVKGHHLYNDSNRQNEKGVSKNSLNSKKSVPECFTILGFDSKPSEDKLKNRYRELVKKYHPDKPDGDSEFFEAINEAYKMAKKYY